MNKAEKNALMVKAILAARAFIERIGMNILDMDYPTTHGVIPLVAMDDGVLVYVNVAVNEVIPVTHIRRYRARMRDYMDEQHLVNTVRYDSISIKVIAADRALLRHHRNIGDAEGEV